MDEAILTRMQEVDAAVKKLTPEVRAAAFSMMDEYILGDEAAVKDETPRQRRKPSPAGDLDPFFEQHESEKDFENALVAAAWWYSQYGVHPFGTKDIRELADQARVTVPTRPDVFLSGVKRDGKQLFAKKGKKLAPTPNGERYMKKTFDVKRGGDTPPEDTA
jgi:hypothetical protein